MPKDFAEVLEKSRDIGTVLMEQRWYNEYRRIYLASSWRNEFYYQTLARLRGEGHLVYDFRNPPDRPGLRWEELGNEFIRTNTIAGTKSMLRSEGAVRAFDGDYAAMEWADTCVMVMPCGASAHLELGWFAGRNKKSIVFFPPGWNDGRDPELMQLVADKIVFDWQELKDGLAER